MATEHGRAIHLVKCFTGACEVSYHEARDLLARSRWVTQRAVEPEVPRDGMWTIYKVSNKIAFAISNKGGELSLWAAYTPALYSWFLNHPEEYERHPSLIPELEKDCQP